MTTHILILCTRNSARSVLGEGMFNHLAPHLLRQPRVGDCKACHQTETTQT